MYAFTNLTRLANCSTPDSYFKLNSSIETLNSLQQYSRHDRSPEKHTMVTKQLNLPNTTCEGNTLTEECLHSCGLSIWMHI